MFIFFFYSYMLSCDTFLTFVRHLLKLDSQFKNNFFQLKSTHMFKLRLMSSFFSLCVVFHIHTKHSFNQIAFTQMTEKPNTNNILQMKSITLVIFTKSSLSNLGEVAKENELGSRSGKKTYKTHSHTRFQSILKLPCFIQ